jgi:cation diffusion facilitator CzcD-associated flavoprotein CzcO
MSGLHVTGHVSIKQRQRGPIWYLKYRLADGRQVQKLLGPERGYDLARRKNIFQQTAVYKLCQRYPVRARALIRWLTARQLPEGYPVDEHFRPRYDPWASASARSLTATCPRRSGRQRGGGHRHD